MRQFNKACLLGLVLMAGVYPGKASPDLQEQPQNVQTADALGRRFDIVVVPGKVLQRFCGHPFEKLRLCRVQNQAWEPIPFQFDEKTPDGRKVLPDEGPEANPQDGNQALDPQDELILMAHDAGSRAAGLQIPEDVEDSIEIALVDPLTKTRSWCYLFCYSGKAPPPSEKQYVYWDWDAKGYDGYIAHGGSYWMKGTTVTFGDHTYKQIDHDVFRTPLEAGGTDVDFLDHLKWVVEIRVMFGSIKYHVDSSKVTGDMLAMRRGPVRCLSRCRAAVRLPAGIKGLKFIADIASWEFCAASSVTRLHVPINPGILVTNIRTRIGEDFSKDASGMFWVNSHNPEGFLVDGLMSPMEKAQNPARDQWRMIVGPQGALLNRAFWTPSFIEQANYVKVSYVDDFQALDPFEFDPGQHAGYSVSEVSNIRPGDYDLAIEWYFPPKIYDHGNGSVHSEMVTEFINIMDHPLAIEADGQTAESNIRPVAMQTVIED